VFAERRSASPLVSQTYSNEPVKIVGSKNTVRVRRISFGSLKIN
jgi:hypothetical protein